MYCTCSVLRLTAHTSPRCRTLRKLLVWCAIGYLRSSGDTSTHAAWSNNRQHSAECCTVAGTPNACRTCTPHIFTCVICCIWGTCRVMNMLRAFAISACTLKTSVLNPDPLTLWYQYEYRAHAYRNFAPKIRLCAITCPEEVSAVRVV